MQKYDFMQTKVIETADGSKTLYVPGLKEHYHSVNGAVQESRHVFIGAGLAYLKKKEVRVFEMGFGTGLNALLSLEYAEQNGKKIDYETVEKYPVEPEILADLDYPSFLSLNADFRAYYEKIMESEWGRRIDISPGFRLAKFEQSIDSFQFSSCYDVVYYDAFAPAVQPELWTPERFEAIAEVINPGGIFVTYCAKGEVRRNLAKCGLETERLPGPPGKREMLRAQKPY